jgi:hypothetical protein
MNMPEQGKQGMRIFVRRFAEERVVKRRKSIYCLIGVAGIALD